MPRGVNQSQRRVNRRLALVSALCTGIAVWNDSAPVNTNSPSLMTFLTSFGFARKSLDGPASAG